MLGGPAAQLGPGLVQRKIARRLARKHAGQGQPGAPVLQRKAGSDSPAIDTSGEAEAEQNEAAVAEGEPAGGGDDAPPAADGLASEFGQAISTQAQGAASSAESGGGGAASGGGQEEASPTASEAASSSAASAQVQRKVVPGGGRRLARKSAGKGGKPGKDSKFGFTAESSGDSREVKANYTIWERPENIPIIPGLLNICIKPEVKAFLSSKAKVKKDGKWVHDCYAGGVEGTVESGVSLGIEGINVYLVGGTGVSGEAELRREKRAWDLDAQIALKYSGDVGIQAGIWTINHKLVDLELAVVTGGMRHENGKWSFKKVKLAPGRSAKMAFEAVAAAAKKVKKAVDAGAKTVGAIEGWVVKQGKNVGKAAKEAERRKDKARGIVVDDVKDKVVGDAAENWKYAKAHPIDAGRNFVGNVRETGGKVFNTLVHGDEDGEESAGMLGAAAAAAANFNIPKQ